MLQLLASSYLVPSLSFPDIGASQTCSMVNHQFGELLVVPATAEHTATVFLLHGLGDSGSGWKPVASQLRLGPHVKWVFPSAPTRPITMNGGASMPGWFDLGTPKQDDAGIQESVEHVNGLIQKEIDAGIASERIVVAGFSQGGHLALKVALKHPRKLGGCIAMSTWLEGLSFPVHTHATLSFLVPDEVKVEGSIPALVVAQELCSHCCTGASRGRPSISDMPWG